MKNNKLLFALLIFISALSINNYSNGSPVFYKPEYNQADSESGFSSGLSNQSLTVNVWGPFGHHKGHYCLIQRMICWHNLSTEFSPLPDYGMAEASVEYNTSGIAVGINFKFFNDPQPINGHLLVDTITPISSGIANALGFQSIILHEGNYLVDTTMLQYGEVTVPADFVGLNEVSVWGPFGKHGPRGNRYCLLPGGICWHRLGVDDLGETDFGMGAASIISNPAGTGLEIHFRFFNDAQPINGHIPVDSNTLLNNQISNALGFKEVLLRGGNYPVDYSNYQYGEISVPVAVVNYGETAAGSPFGRHKCTWEAHYCLCRGGICWKDIFHLSEETVLLNEYGWYAMSEFTNTVGAGSSIKIRFLNDPQPDSLGYLSVDTVKLSQDLSNELGFGSVTLLGGDYFVDYSNYQYGEITVGAILDGPVKTLNLKVIPEGYLTNSAISNMKDISLIYLRSHLSPYSIVDSASVLIDSVSLSGTCYFSAQSGNYYIAVKHRNSIETWSANPVAISFTTTNYDFTIGSSQAFANNVVFKFGKWCTYSGDVNQDASINLNDVILVYNNANNFVTGYSATDVTGNNITDLSDLLITFNNANSFVVKITP